MHFRLLMCPLFKGFSPQETEQLLQSNAHQYLSFSDKQIIELRGDYVEHLWIVVEGKVKGEMIDKAGKLVKIEDISAPMPLAVAFLFSNPNTFPVTITSNGSSKLVRLPKSSILNMMQKNVKFLQNYLSLVSNKAKFLSDRIFFLSFKSLRQKIAHYIIEEAGENSFFQLKIGQQELADYFGTARPSIARILSTFEAEGIIRYEKREIHIINKQKLISSLN